VPASGNQWHAQVAQAAAAYGTNPKLLRGINQREQSGTSNFVVNDWDSNAQRGTPSGGPFQFIQPTFSAYARQAQQANPQAWKGVKADWKNPYAQALAASWALANGKGKAWTTYSKALADAGGQVKGPAQTTPAPVSDASSGEATTTIGKRFTDKQSAALAMVFDTNPRMKKLLGAIDTTRVDVVRPTKEAQAVGGGSVGKELVATAMAEVGKTANDAMRYIKAAGGSGYEPWCGDFVQWVFKQRGLAAPPARSVPALMAWAKKNNKLVNNPQAGDLVTFDWNGDGKADHVEMVRGKVKGGVATVGGNTSGAKAGSQVAAKNRTSNILGYVRAS